MNRYIHPLSDVHSSNIGVNTLIWQYCVVFQGAFIGKDWNICSHTLIENDVIVGDRVSAQSDMQLWVSSRLVEGIIIGPIEALTNEQILQCRQYPESFSFNTARTGSPIGEGAKNWNRKKKSQSCSRWRNNCSKPVVARWLCGRWNPSTHRTVYGCTA